MSPNNQPSEKPLFLNNVTIITKANKQKVNQPTIKTHTLRQIKKKPTKNKEQTDTIQRQTNKQTSQPTIHPARDQIKSKTNKQTNKLTNKQTNKQSSCIN